MSAPVVPTPYRTYADNMWRTYITEAIQSGNHKQYCEQHNIAYRTFKRKYAEYKQCENTENLSPKSKRRYSHRVFTDSTEKQAHAEWKVKYDDTPLCSDSGDLSAILMKTHNTYHNIYQLQHCVQRVCQLTRTRVLTPTILITQIVINGNNNNVTIHNNQYNVSVFNIPGNTQPVRDEFNNLYTNSESGNMNNDKLIEFIETVIADYTQDKPAALFLDSLGYQHNKRTTDVANKHNITVYRIPPSTTAWLQPCDVTLFGPTKQKVKTTQKRERQIGIDPTLRRACELFSDALHSFGVDMVQRTWDRLRVSTPEQLRCKSSSSTLRRTKSSPIQTSSSSL